ncbi:hypothetical protein SAMN02745164_00031 [Marinitoga hydrogenitolerans DSM 16785]|uniref:Uncharacterized protein n=1 Tax=Marinitoga hydrogenitolerans (strain DSM 16785 / JCM 12826 / AT1271) TaxID=1122195 RepID=A0A1M4S5F9_MARH1|nr:hypothetical protein [Marinitoga hydrogenitolerans]SHE27247.1 hypothetical protein SAMN02745164_00031 [Marinitoga hydrogenitolerans DSM 16785]
MYKEILKTLYSFLGENILNEENKLKTEIFDKLSSKSDFYEILDFLKSESFPQVVEEKFLSLFIISLFNRLRISVDIEKKSLMYGNENISVDIFDKNIIQMENILKELLDLIDYSNLPTEYLFGILSQDISKRLRVFKELIGNSKITEEKWEEQELQGLINSLTDSTREFLKYMVKKGKSSKEEIIKDLNLRDTRSVSAFTSAISRNSPTNKERILFGEKGKIIINEEYRDILKKLLLLN